MNKVLFIIAATFLFSGVLSSELHAQSPKSEIKSAVSSFDTTNGFSVDVYDKNTQQQYILTVKGEKYELKSNDGIIFGDNGTRYTYVKANNEIIIETESSSPAKLFSEIDGFEYSYTNGKKTERPMSLYINGTETVKNVTAIDVVNQSTTIYLSCGKIVAIGDGNSLLCVGTPRKLIGSGISFKPSDHPDAEIIDFR